MQVEFQPRCRLPRRLVRPVQLDPSGETGPTRSKAQGPHWRRTTKGYYVPAGTAEDVVEQRVLEQSMRLPPAGVVTGWAAVRLAGAAYFDGLDRDGRGVHPVPLLVPEASKLRTLPGSEVRRERIDPSDVTEICGIRCAVPVRAVFDEMRRVREPREAVVALDMAAAAELVSIAEMRAYVAKRLTWRRSRRVRWAVGLASELSVSPNETRMRLVWVLDAGLPQPMVNQDVWDLAGRHLGRADLLDSDAGVVGEFDGATHRRAGRHARDARREDLLRRAGLEYFTVVGPDIWDHDLVADRMLSTRDRAVALRRPRLWTLQAPGGWWHTETAADRLAHRGLVASPWGAGVSAVLRRSSGSRAQT